MLIVAPLHQVEGIRSRRRPSHVISLASPTGKAARTEASPSPSLLSLSFHDITEVRTGLVAPDSKAIGAILDFARTWDGANPLLVHCWAGISRSCAAAFILACNANAGIEPEIAAALRRRAPFATPNRLMVAIADDMLSRGGRMVDAIAAIGRGAEAPHGEPFDFPVHPPFA
jgi:predicted protein tyrosine phosphatase